jgi:hypothetical protein
VVLEIRVGIIHLCVSISDKFKEAFDSTRELCGPLGIGLALVDLDLRIKAIAIVERTEEFVPDSDAIRWVKVTLWSCANCLLQIWGRAKERADDHPLWS